MKSFSVAFGISSDQQSFLVELFITWAKRQVQDLRRSRMPQSCFFTGTRLGTLSPCVFGLRWLDTVFHGQYLPSLSINYVAINKVLQKLPSQLY